MDNKSLIKGSLQAISTTLVGLGASLLIAKDLYGLVLIGVGVGLTIYRGFYKLQ